MNWAELFQAVGWGFAGGVAAGAVIALAGWLLFVKSRRRQ